MYLHCRGGGSNRKVLVLDPGLRNPLELVVGGAFLQQHGVIRTHLLDDDGHNLADDEIGSIVFIRYWSHFKLCFFSSLSYILSCFLVIAGSIQRNNTCQVLFWIDRKYIPSI